MLEAFGGHEAAPGERQFMAIKPAISRGSKSQSKCKPAVTIAMDDVRGLVLPPFKPRRP
jgi:hypothetical protein